MNLSIDGNDNTVIKRFALKYDPATLIIIYCLKGKTLKRKLKFKNINTKLVNAESIVEKLLATNYDLLSPHLVSREQIVDLIRLLLYTNISEANSTIEDLLVDKKDSLSKSTSKIRGDFNSNKASEPLVDGEIDLNKVEESVNMKFKNIMNTTFNSNRLTPADEGFIYDKRVDFEPPNETCEWDDED